jgi:hypothetical protein
MRLGGLYSLSGGFGEEKKRIASARIHVNNHDLSKEIKCPQRK